MTTCIDKIKTIYRKTATKYFNESSNHSRIAVLMCIDFVIIEVEKHAVLTKFILWSDACAAQFRSPFVFKLISTYRPDLLIDWHYNETHHGKGIMDGIDDTIKILYFFRVSRVKLSSTRQKIFVMLRTSCTLQLPRCFKNQMWSLVNLVILKKHQS